MGDEIGDSDSDVDGYFGVIFLVGAEMRGEREREICS